jgi:serine phosphatase RsbU (regulator of sigma subunit)
MAYYYILLYASVVIFITIIIMILIILKRSITLRFSRMVFIIQYIIYIAMYTFWVYRLNEIRIFGLFCALIALTFVLSNSNVIQSLLMSMGTAVIHVSVSFVAIHHAGQQGSFKQELFYVLCFVPSFLLLSLVAGQMNRNRKMLSRANRELKRMNEELLAQQDLNDVEKDLASNIQASLFPSKPPLAAGWDIAFTFKPRYGVSGDFYDFYYLEERLKGLSIFDVTGHGVPSALITILAKPIIFQYFRRFENKELGAMMESMNRRLSGDLDEINLYITGIVLRFSGNVVEYANAGHPDLLCRRNSGRVAVIESREVKFKGSPIGVYGLGNPCKTVQFNIASGDLLLLFTDGLLESTNSRKEEYGWERLIKSLEEAPDDSAQDILAALLDEFYSFVDERAMKDDLTVIVAKKV